MYDHEVSYCSHELVWVWSDFEFNTNTEHGYIFQMVSDFIILFCRCIIQLKEAVFIFMGFHFKALETYQWKILDHGKINTENALHNLLGIKLVLDGEKHFFVKLYY